MMTLLMLPVAIGDTYGNDVKGNDLWVDIEVDKPRNLVAKFPTNMSATTWWSYLELIQIAPPGGQI
jgi:hypothetical protein